MKIKHCWLGEENQTKSIDMDAEILPLLVLDLGLDIIDGIGRLNLKGRPQGGCVVGGGDVQVSKDQALLVRRDTVECETSGYACRALTPPCTSNCNSTFRVIVFAVKALMKICNLS